MSIRQALVASVMLALAGAFSIAAGSSPRSDQTINSGWKFLRQDVDGAAASDFNDAQWQSLSLPHTWNNLDGQDGGSDYYRGPGWYRKHIQIAGGQQYFLRFEGASIQSEVFVNGTSVGKHGNGFGSFCFDVTPQVRAGDNVIAVKVDNAHFEDVPPTSADFTFFGGIYRDVHLITLNALSISPVDDASCGVFLKQTNVSADGADVQATVDLLNRSNAEKPASVQLTIRDPQGQVVQQASLETTVAANGAATPTLKVRIDHPHLWNGLKDAYCYQAQVQLKDGDTMVDQIDQPLGLRYFSFDPNKGFFLNGQHYDLRGVNRHQDRIDKGWAISRADEDEDYGIIAEMGCSTVRLSHYQQSEHFYDLCDRGGMVVWAEACLVNELVRKQPFYDSCRQQLRELIKQNYNHPSIVFWSVFNEINFGKQDRPKDWEILTQLNDLAHELDDTRKTVGASNRPPEHPANWVTDVIAFNGYWGWYSDTVAAWEPRLNHYHQFAPDKCIGISEYGAGASIYMHETPPTHPSAAGYWRTEEYQSAFHEAVWKAIKERPWIWGAFVWNEFDFAADQRHEGDHLGRNDKGLVTYDRKTRKDAFYFYKCNWSQTPTVYITSRRFAERAAGETEIKVYSNCDNVELRANGKALGTLSGDDLHRFIWRTNLELGQNLITAIATKNGQTLSDEVTWQANPGATTRYADLSRIDTKPEASAPRK